MNTRMSVWRGASMWFVRVLLGAFATYAAYAAYVFAWIGTASPGHREIAASRSTMWLLLSGLSILGIVATFVLRRGKPGAAG